MNSKLEKKLSTLKTIDTAIGKRLVHYTKGTWFLNFAASTPFIRWPWGCMNLCQKSNSCMVRIKQRRPAARRQGCKEGLQHWEDGTNSQAFLALMFPPCSTFAQKTTFTCCIILLSSDRNVKNKKPIGLPPRKRRQHTWWCRWIGAGII